MRLLSVLAHPDDETLGVGGTLARYAAEGVETYLVTATRGERGWFGDPARYPGEDALGAIRESELCCAAQALNVRDIAFLDYLDGELDRASAAEAIAQIVTHIRRVRPHVVLTFDPNGFYGHPDHIAISQFTTAAVVAAADRDYPLGGLPHRVAKLYYRVPSREQLEAYQAVFGELVMQVDGLKRRPVPWEPWAITTQIDTRAFVEQIWTAVHCHRSQLPSYEQLLHLDKRTRAQIFGSDTFYRVFSLVNGGRGVETDLFEGVAETVKRLPAQPSAR